MKFHLPIVGLSIAALISPTVVQAQPPAEEAVVCTAGSGLNLRETPGGRILDALSPGTTVMKVAPPAGNWQPIATENYRGYVWGTYLCSELSHTEPEKEPDKEVVIRPRPHVTPARCGKNDENLRNIHHRGGLEIYDRPTSESEKVGFVGDGGVVRLSGASMADDDGVIWQPINYPELGYLEAGRDGLVPNLVYCTRFYE